VLDVACGAGRHLRWFHARGARVTGVDCDAEVLEPLKSLGRMVVADIEAGPWPLGRECFDAIVVTNYLWRPLMPTLIERLAPQGVLIYETFGEDQAQYGRPRNPAFLLKRMELIELTQCLRVIAYEDRVVEDPTRHVQRIVAVKPASTER
jgi:SAM-dependent methyltransferase